ncbi:MAG: co-chaperone GroES [Candidatus Sungbacteria bacterium]|nr:co-chaperone GroES [Candidatus Sungbacteria bacterium]
MIRPLGDRVLIEPISEEEGKTKTGIYLPETAEKERPMKGTVVAVGDGKLLDSGKRQPLSVRKGNKVLFTKYGPTELKVEGKEYLIAREEDILAILD